MTPKVAMWLWVLVPKKENVDTHVCTRASRGFRVGREGPRALWWRAPNGGAAIWLERAGSAHLLPPAPPAATSPSPSAAPRRSCPREAGTGCGLTCTPSCPTEPGALGEWPPCWKGSRDCPSSLGLRLGVCRLVGSRAAVSWGASSRTHTQRMAPFLSWVIILYVLKCLETARTYKEDFQRP